MLETANAASDLISFLQAIPDTQMRRGIRIPAGYLLLVVVLGILSKSESLRDLERFARRRLWRQVPRHRSPCSGLAQLA